MVVALMFAATIGFGIATFGGIMGDEWVWRAGLTLMLFVIALGVLGGLA
jgi:hypothetical protein